LNFNTLQREQLEAELQFSASRSSGPGGQNVNKVSTKIELRFNISECQHLTEDDKNLLFSKLKNAINNKGELIIVSQSERSQLKNKEAAIERFFKLLEQALTKPKKRTKTKPTLASKAERLASKKLNSQKKSFRRPTKHLDE